MAKRELAYEINICTQTKIKYVIYITRDQEIGR